MRLKALTILLAFLMAATGCATHLVPPGPAVEPPRETPDAFVMPDGMRLPYRTWLPDHEPKAVILALHGMNDSRDAWEYPGPELAAHGIAVFSPDQRGFGETVDRGFWPGTAALVDDARTMAELLHRRYPHAKLILMGESMGAAVLMCLSASPPPAAGGRLRAGGARRLGPGGDERVPARRAVADGEHGAGYDGDRPHRRQGRQRQPRGDPAVVARIR